MIGPGSDKNNDTLKEWLCPLFWWVDRGGPVNQSDVFNINNDHTWSTWVNRIKYIWHIMGLSDSLSYSLSLYLILKLKLENINRFLEPCTHHCYLSPLCWGSEASHLISSNSELKKWVGPWVNSKCQKSLMRANREVVDAPFYDFGAETQEFQLLVNQNEQDFQFKRAEFQILFKQQCHVVLLFLSQPCCCC